MKSHSSELSGTHTVFCVPSAVENTNAAFVSQAEIVQMALKMTLRWAQIGTGRGSEVQAAFLPFLWAVREDCSVFAEADKKVSGLLCELHNNSHVWGRKWKHAMFTLYNTFFWNNSKLGGSLLWAMKLRCLMKVCFWVQPNSLEYSFCISSLTLAISAANCKWEATSRVCSAEHPVCRHSLNHQTKSSGRHNFIPIYSRGNCYERSRNNV